MMPAMLGDATRSDEPTFARRCWRGMMALFASGVRIYCVVVVLLGLALSFMPAAAVPLHLRIQTSRPATASDPPELLLNSGASAFRVQWIDLSITGGTLQVLQVRDPAYNLIWGLISTGGLFKVELFSLDPEDEAKQFPLAAEARNAAQAGFAYRGGNLAFLRCPLWAIILPHGLVLLFLVWRRLRLNLPRARLGGSAVSLVRVWCVFVIALTVIAWVTSLLSTTEFRLHRTRLGSISDQDIAFNLNGMAVIQTQPHVVFEASHLRLTFPGVYQTNQPSLTRGEMAALIYRSSNAKQTDWFAELKPFRRQVFALRGVAYVIAFWPILVSHAIVLALIEWRRAVRRRRNRVGHCPECGYDLRESSERCPECGYATGA